MARRSKPRRGNRRPLNGLEPLERRWLLAGLDIGINLFRDDGGAPGAMITDDTVALGEAFFVEITAEDVRAMPQGLTDLSLGVSWDPDVLEEINAAGDIPSPPAEVPISSPVLTPQLPLTRLAALDNPAGTISTLEATSDSTAIGASGAERFSLLHFRAEQAVVASPLTVTLAQDGAAFADGDPLDINQLTIDSQTIDVTAPEVSIQAAVMVDEGQPASFIVSLSETSDSEITVLVDTVSDSASASSDFSPLAAQLVTFAPGETQVQVDVATITDSRVEGDETFQLALSNPIGATLGTATGTATILDLNSATITFAATSSDAREDRTPHTVELVLAIPGGGTLDRDVLVDLDDLPTSTADDPEDYSLLVPRLIFPEGSTDGTTVQTTIDIVDDGVEEPLEILDLDLQIAHDPTGRVLLAGSHRVRILDASLPFVTVADSEVLEADDAQATLRFTIRLSRPGDSDVTVTVNTEDATATSQSGDYQPLVNVPVVIPARSTSAAVDVVVHQDALIEGTETLRLVLSDPENGQLDPNAAIAVGTIREDDSATIRFQDAVSTVNESEPRADVLVVLLTGGGVLERPVTVSVVDTLLGSAQEPGDYTFASSTSVTFAAGSGHETTMTVSLAPNDDALVEGDETIQLDLEIVDDGTGGQVILDEILSHELTIQDNDQATLSFADAASSTSESDASPTVDVRLNVNGGGTLAADVTFDIVDLGTGSAIDGSDYRLVDPTTFTFPAGSADGAVRSLTLNILGDQRVEGDETIRLGLADIVDSTGRVSLESGLHEVTILDNDMAFVSFVLDQSSVLETAGSHTIEVLLEIPGEGTLDRTITVDVVDLMTGTADPTADYTLATPQTLTFAQGSTDGARQSVTLALADDALEESPESVQIRLDNLAGVAEHLLMFGQARDHTLTIEDDESAAAAVAFDAAETDVDESAGNHSVAVRLSVKGEGLLEEDFTVEVRDLTSGLAAEGGDYTFATQQVTFAAGTAHGATRLIDLSVLDDMLVEGSETLRLGLAKVTENDRFILGTISQHKVTILDNETITVHFVTGQSNAGEAAGSHMLAVQLDLAAGTALERELSVGLTQVDGNAAVPGDLTFDVAEVTFAAGSSDGATLSFTLTIEDDDRVEGDETATFSLSVTSTTGIDDSALGDPATHQVTIADNDTATLVLVATSSQASEAAGTHSVPVRLDIPGGGSLERPVTATLADLGTGTATAGTDYSLGSSQVTFPVGAADGTLRAVDASITSDLLVEGDETVLLELRDLDDGTGGQVSLGGESGHAITITDDDTAQLALEAAASSVLELAGTHTVSVLLTLSDEASLLDRTVSVDVVDLLTGTASTPDDYALAGATTLTFPAGSASGTTRSVQLNIVMDSIEGESETVHLRLEGLVDPSGGQVALASPTEHTVTITDDASNAELSGVVYLDANNNGSRDVGETGIPGVLVALAGTSNTGTAIALEVMTGDDGAYAFVDLPGGTYALTETQPRGMRDGTDQVGTQGGTTENDRLSAISLSPGQLGTENDFGEQGFEPQFLTIRLLLASASVPSATIRDTLARVEHATGDPQRAMEIHDATRPSTASPTTGENPPPDGEAEPEAEAAPQPAARSAIAPDPEPAAIPDPQPQAEAEPEAGAEVKAEGEAGTEAGSVGTTASVAAISNVAFRGDTAPTDSVTTTQVSAPVEAVDQELPLYPPASARAVASERADLASEPSTDDLLEALDLVMQGWEE